MAQRAPDTEIDMNEVIKKLDGLVKSQFGSDMTVSIARCPAFGHSDVCYIVKGKNHNKAAKSLVSAHKSGLVESKVGGFVEDGTLYEYSTVTIAA